MMQLLTQFTYEKKWSKTSKEDAFNIIEREMPETDIEGTWKYILNEIGKGKTITLGDCRFKLESEEKSK